MKFSRIHPAFTMDKHSYRPLKDYTEKTKAIQQKTHEVEKDHRKSKAKWPLLTAYK